MLNPFYRRGASALQLKKIYVLAGLLVEEHKKLRKTRAKSTVKFNFISGFCLILFVIQGVSGFLEEDESVSDSRVLSTAWRGALAYHFYLMSQRQLYEGYIDAAMHTASVLKVNSPA